MEHWWCLDCLAEIETDRHGRCGVCGSEALGRIGLGQRPYQTQPLAELQQETSIQGSLTALANSVSRLLRRIALTELGAQERVCTH